MDRNVQVQGKQTNRAPQDSWWWRRRREVVREGAKEIRRAGASRGCTPEGLEQGELTWSALQKDHFGRREWIGEGRDGDRETASVSLCY